MTREAAIQRKEALEARRMKLVDQLTDVDVTSATMSSTGGSRSYTNRTVSDIKAKIRFIDREIAALDAAINGTAAPGAIKTVYMRFNG